MITLYNEKDFESYKKFLDENSGYQHRHIGEPMSYPCKVLSTWYDDPNGPYMYEHKFIYITEQKCPYCGEKIEILSGNKIEIFDIEEI